MLARVGLWSRRVFPALMDFFCRDSRIAPLRREALATARGDVLEIGFGTGLNLRYYPEAVAKVIAIEPNVGMGKRAAKRIGESARKVELVHLEGEKLPLPDASVDTAVSTFTLCSVRDPAAVLSEIRRVLKPEGRFLFLEHGLADDPRIAKWQHRLTPIQKRVADGCHLDRDVRAMVAGPLTIETVRSQWWRDVPKVGGWLTLGVARK